jgi:hypothetical protein
MASLLFVTIRYYREGPFNMSKIAYNEFKFLVPNEKLDYVRDLLNGLYGHSDSFPEGVVDSIYYDSLDRACYRQCLDGEPRKSKFRIRGYGNNHFSQVHLKTKDVFGVSKLKNTISWSSDDGMAAPDWDEIRHLGKPSEALHGIMSAADQYGRLVPAIRVRYYRYRYRIHDYRMTLDTRIETQGFSNGWDNNMHYGILPYHVLELKTLDSRPVLPFMNLIQLPQISFSKFFLGSQLLEDGVV